MNSIEFTNFDKLDYVGAEGLNTLCTNLTFAGEDIRTIMTTSCHASEGKSFITMNMMRTFAQIGKRVVLVDADLRRSVLFARYGVRKSQRDCVGLTHYLAGMCEMDQVLYATNIPGAYIVPAGRMVSNSLALLTSPRLKQLLAWLKQNFDLVLVDAPPVGVIIDAVEISKSCDGVLIVVNHNKVTRRELTEVAHQLRVTDCRILGAVLNNVSLDSYSSKRYYYRSYYSSHYESGYYTPEEKRDKKRSSKRKEQPAKRAARKLTEGQDNADKKTV